MYDDEFYQRRVESEKHKLKRKNRKWKNRNKHVSIQDLEKSQYDEY